MTSDEKTVEELFGRLADIATALLEPDKDGRILSVGLVRGSRSDWFHVQCGAEAFGDGSTLRDAVEYTLARAEERLSRRVSEAEAMAERLRAATRPAEAQAASVATIAVGHAACSATPQAIVHNVRLNLGDVERIVAGAVRGGPL
jgi:hypothetical protein